jgi:hypothetical protein
LQLELILAASEHKLKLLILNFQPSLTFIQRIFKH